MFELAVFADRRRLAVALRLCAVDAERGNGLFESNSPSSSPMAIRGERSSTYLPANDFRSRQSPPRAGSAARPSDPFPDSLLDHP